MRRAAVGLMLLDVSKDRGHVIFRGQQSIRFLELAQNFSETTGIARLRTASTSEDMKP
jgi:hypothetical protein